MNQAPYRMLPRTLAGVIFDCDGVMIDSRIANAIYYNKILEALALPPLTAEQEAYTYMATVHQSLEHITPPHLRHRLSDVCGTVVNYSRDIMPFVQLSEGFMDFILWLHGQKVRLGVHTNRSNGMATVMDAFALHPYLDPVMTASIVQPKPHPEGVFHILTQWQVSPDQVLFVGDSPNDQQTAKAAGVPFAAFGNPALDAAVKVDTFRELADIVRPCLALPQ